MCKTEIKIQRRKLWKNDPRCENCGVVTILPKDLPKQIMEKNPPDNMATIQHKYPKGSPKRLEYDPNERRHFLWCLKCNDDDNNIKNKSGLLNHTIL